MHSIYVWNMIKQSKPLQTRYDTTYIYDRYYIRTHVYVFLFSVNYRELGLEHDLLHVIYRPCLSLHYSNLFEESRALWL